MKGSYREGDDSSSALPQAGRATKPQQRCSAWRSIRFPWHPVMVNGLPFHHASMARSKPSRAMHSGAAKLTACGWRCGLWRRAQARASRLSASPCSEGVVDRVVVGFEGIGRLMRASFEGFIRGPRFQTGALGRCLPRTRSKVEGRRRCLPKRSNWRAAAAG
jgi:hypothetical protein